METMKVQAGGELDALIAEKVMGLSLQPEPIEPMFGYTILDTSLIPKPYSTFIAAAWEVVEKLRSMKQYGHGFRVEWTDSELWVAGWVVVGDRGQDELSMVNYAEGDTAPLAICRAALKAVNI